MKRNRLLNRVRVLLDGQLTPANALDKAAASHPDSPIFHLPSPGPYRALPGVAVTPAELLGFANRVGNVLLDNGLRRGDRVAIYHTNGAEYFFLALAVVKAGGTAVPINPGMAVDGLRRHLAAAGCRLVLTDARQFTERIGDHAAVPEVTVWFFPDLPSGFTGKGVGLNEATATASADLAPVDLAPDDPVLLVHTSGTTGRPKLVPSTSARLASGIKRHYVDEPITRRTRTAVAGHFNHLVYYVGFYSSLMGNLPVWPISDHSVQSIAGTVARERIAIFFAFPDVYARIYRHGLPPRAFDSIRIWVTTADASHEAHVREFCRAGAYLRVAGRPVVPSLFVEAFGTSEVGFAALRRIRSRFSPPRYDRCVGRRTLGGPRSRVVGPDGRRARAGEVGRIEVNGPTVFAGYWDPDDVQRHEGPHAGWWWTGDLGRRDRLGRIHQLDRAVDVVRTTSGPVYGLPLEEKLLTHPAVADAVVIGVPHPDGGDVPVALISLRDGAALDGAELRAWATEAAGLRDARIVGEEEVPRGLTGKVLRRVLRERHAGWFGSGEQEPGRQPERGLGHPVLPGQQERGGVVHDGRGAS
ncbi:class I adenylate-forming enzyme family protein [Asanoa sp. NPDC049573]|uniref:class I adenylate-forming enzyme family protein n=1 Tax=Asanoa sp. NPDC049573 TaxID=3155396 RepID=UPI0034272592